MTSIPICFSTPHWSRQFNVVGLFWLNRVGLPPVVLGPNIQSKGVETGPIATQFGPTYAQIMPRLPGACLWRAELFQVSCGRQI